MSFFPEIGKIQYEGPTSKNPLAYKFYNPDEIVENQRLKDLMRFTVCYWHTFRGTGSDPFGSGTLQRPWDDGSDSVANAVKRVDAAFEFIEKLGCPYYAFHDRDVAPEGDTLSQTNKNLDEVVKALKARMEVRAQRKAEFARLRDTPAFTRDGSKITLLMNAGLAVDLDIGGGRAAHVDHRTDHADELVHRAA